MRTSVPGSWAAACMPEPAGMPRHVWRRLFTSLPVRPGAAALVVDNQPQAVAGWLQLLNFRVTVVSDGNFPADEHFSRQIVGSDVVVWDGRRKLAFPRHEFDVAFVQPLPSHGTNWLSAEARRTTASLLATLKPLAHLIWWQRPAVETGHLPACWVKHLGCFPGSCEAWDIPDAFFSRSTWRALCAGKRRSATSVVVWQAPRELLSVEEWSRYAQRGFLTGRRDCCEWAARRQQTNLRAA